MPCDPPSRLQPATLSGSHHIPETRTWSGKAGQAAPVNASAQACFPEIRPRLAFPETPRCTWRSGKEGRPAKRFRDQCLCGKKRQGLGDCRPTASALRRRADAYDLRLLATELTQLQTFTPPFHLPGTGRSFRSERQQLALCAYRRYSDRQPKNRWEEDERAIKSVG